MLRVHRAFWILIAIASTGPLAAAEPSQTTGVIETAADAASGEPVARKVEPGAEEYWKALKLMRSKKPEDLEAARAALQTAAAREYTHAQLLLGECYEQGSYGFAQNKSKAAAHFRLAAERGNAFAKLSYGLCLFSGFGVRQDEAKAQEWLSAVLAEQADYSLPERPANWESDRAADDDGVAGALVADPVASAKARAHFVLGIIAERRKKSAEAQTHYVAAATAGSNARAGIQLAAFQAALNYAFGRGVPRDPAKATGMLTLARTLVQRNGISLIHNYAEAKLLDDFAVSEMEESIAKSSDELASELQLDIARQFTDRKSKDYNPQEAVQWFELAAESGKVWAMLELAQLYARGDLGTRAPEKAFAWFEKAGGGDTPKHDLGLANLIICHANGIGTAKAPDKALALAQKFKERELVSYLTTIGQCPDKILSYEDTVALTKQWAKKDPFGQYFLGMRYEFGWGVSTNFDQAVSCYEKAAKKKCGPACRRLGDLYQTRRMDVVGQAAERKAVELYRAGAEVKDPGSITSLGYCTQRGLGMPQDLIGAQTLYEQSLRMDPDQPMALNNLGSIYEARFRSTTRAEDATAAEYRGAMLKYYEEAAQKGNALAAKNLGRLHYEGALGQRDFEKAYGYFEKAAELGDREARFHLAEMHEKGEGVPVTPVEAAYHYRLAALDGDIESLRRLANFYLEGKGGAQDLERAKFWLLMLAQQGSPGALRPLIDVTIRQEKYKEAIEILNVLVDSDDKWLAGYAYERLSRFYGQGVGVKANASRAKRYHEKALQLGDADALFSAGLERLRENKGPEGVELLKKGAAADSSDACFVLGQMYHQGQYVTADVSKSVEYLRHAAQLNHAGALYYLAGMTYNRIPGAPTLEEAIQFARHAEALGREHADTLREKLEKRRHDGAAPAETKAPRSA